ncbi:hypothetical protein BX666DRAFT_124824 [Dichotomocladium elegans]|nr:hypothetical protein BX666DRAFT_124824 [Dichotomocladium elegans]
MNQRKARDTQRERESLTHAPPEKKKTYETHFQTKTTNQFRQFIGVYVAPPPHLPYSSGPFGLFPHSFLPCADYRKSMSWKGFSKALSRIPYRIKSKTNDAEVSMDEAYLKLQLHFNELAYHLPKMNNDIMVYKNAVQDAILAQCDFLDRFRNVYHDPQLPGARNLEEYLTDATKTRDQIRAQMDAANNVLLASLNELGQVLAEAEKTMATRSRKKSDYDRCKGDEKGTAARDYEEQNIKLKNELPVLFSYVDQIMQILLAQLLGLQCTIHRLFLDHVSSQISHLPSIRRNSMDDYCDRVTPVSEIIELLELSHHQKSETTPIPPPKFLDDAQEDPSISGLSSNRREGLGIIPNTYEHQDISLSNDRMSPCFGIAISTYEAQGIGDISFRKNQPIEVLASEDSEDGWYIAKIGREIGLVPSSHIRLLKQEHVNT